MEDRHALVFDPMLCSGCMYCMVACSTWNSGLSSLSNSRIRIIRHEGHAISGPEEEDELVFVSVNCQQCEDPYCAYVCPVNAIRRDPDTGALKIDHDRCVGCRSCMMICPFGAISYDPARAQVFKCELCEGDPWCTKVCASGALKFLPVRIANLDRVAKTAEKQKTILMTQTKS
jgi:carbon-monoxide dehydrogenase iron sulfur subunit